MVDAVAEAFVDHLLVLNVFLFLGLFEYLLQVPLHPVQCALVVHIQYKGEPLDASMS